MSFRLTDSQAQRVGTLLASVQRRPEALNTQDTYAYGRITPESGVRRRSAAVRPRDRRTCIGCGRILTGDQEKFCAGVCLDGGGA